MAEKIIKSFDDRYNVTDEKIKEEQKERSRNRMMRRFQSVYDDIQDKIDSTNEQIDNELNKLEAVDINRVLELSSQLDKLEAYSDKIKIKLYPGLFPGEKIR